MYSGQLSPFGTNSSRNTQHPATPVSLTNSDRHIGRIVQLLRCCNRKYNKPHLLIIIVDCERPCNQQFSIAGLCGACGAQDGTVGG